MYKQRMKSKRLGAATIRHRNAETVKGEGHPAFTAAKKEEVIIVRLSADDKERLRLAARPLSLSAFVRARLGIGGGS
jgi:hypothetical protein